MNASAIEVPSLRNAYAQMQTGGRRRGTRGELVWPGLLRRLDRIDPSYRD